MLIRTQCESRRNSCSTFTAGIPALSQKTLEASVLSFYSAAPLSLPCGPNVMVAMAEHSTAVEKVREQLIRIMQDEELRTAVELLADIIKDIRKNPHDLSGLHFEAQRFIPENSQYDESYWIAAHVLYLNGSDFIKLCKEIESIKDEISIIYEYLRMLDRELETGQEAIWALYRYLDKLNTFLEEISEKADELYKRLSSLKKDKDKILYDSIRERYYFLDEIVDSIEDRIGMVNKEIKEAEKYIEQLNEEHEAVRRHLRKLEDEKWYIIDLIRDILYEIEYS